VVADPITWSAGLIAGHIAVYNALFATTQLLLALGLLYRPTARVALTASIPWAIAVWWIGEGLGGVLGGTANPVTGAPGAAILYVFLALLAWPSEAAPPGGPGLGVVAALDPHPVGQQLPLLAQGLRAVPALAGPRHNLRPGFQGLVVVGSLEALAKF
jgi:hypothetical protein